MRVKQENVQWAISLRRPELGVSFPFCVKEWWQDLANKLCTVILTRMSATAKQQVFGLHRSSGRARLYLCCTGVKEDFVMGLEVRTSWNVGYLLVFRRHHCALLEHGCFYGLNPCYCSTFSFVVRLMNNVCENMFSEEKKNTCAVHHCLVFTMLR